MTENKTLTRRAKGLSANRDNGRTALGRFAAGNPGGPGNPQAAHVNALRAALQSAVTPVDIRNVMRAMVKLALDGDVAAAKLVLDRCLGAVAQPVEISADALTAEELAARVKAFDFAALKRALNPPIYLEPVKAE